MITNLPNGDEIGNPSLYTCVHGILIIEKFILTYRYSKQQYFEWPLAWLEQPKICLVCSGFLRNKNSKLRTHCTTFSTHSFPKHVWDMFGGLFRYFWRYVRECSGFLINYEMLWALLKLFRPSMLWLRVTIFDFDCKLNKKNKKLNHINNNFTSHENHIASK